MLRIEQAQVEQVNVDWIKYFPGREQAIGGRLKMPPIGLCIGILQCLYRLLDVLPELGGRQDIFMLHRFKERLYRPVAEADAVKGSTSTFVQIHQAAIRIPGKLA